MNCIHGLKSLRIAPRCASFSRLLRKNIRRVSGRIRDENPPGGRTKTVRNKSNCCVLNRLDKISAHCGGQTTAKSVGEFTFKTETSHTAARNAARESAEKKLRRQSHGLEPQFAIRENHRPETAQPLQEFFRTGRKSLVHPMTWFALFNPAKKHALNFKFLPDPLIQVDARRNHVAPEDRRFFIMHVQRTAQRLVSFHREESDLARVIRFVIEESIADDASSRNALDFTARDSGICSRRTAMMAEEIVPARNIKVSDLHP